MKALKHFIKSITFAFITFSIVTPTLAHIPDFTELVDKNSPAVVNISTLKFSKNNYRSLPPQLKGIPEDWLKFFYQQPPEEGGTSPWQDDNRGKGKPELNSLGSGFIVSEDGYLITNHHVVKGAEKIIVRFNDLRELTATLIGSDERTDVALLKVDANDLPVVKLGNSSELKVGEWVVAIGSPFGFDYSVTAGIVSAKRRSLPRDLYVPFIQTDVAINPGNSGGPLFNLDGEVVGINSQIYSRNGGFMGVSFAIPIDLVMNVVEQLKQKGVVHRGFLGVQIQAVTSELSESFNLSKPQGALVSAIIPDSPASKVGIKIGDIILKYRDTKVEQSYELPPMVGVTPIDETVEIEILRQGKKITLTPKIVALDRGKTNVASAEKLRDIAGVIDSIGIQVIPLPTRFAENLEYGIYVKNVKLNGSSANAGIRPGDVLMRVQGKKITSVETLKKIIEDIPKKTRVPVLIWRNAQTMFTTITIP